jgi:hypothetical protein
LKIHVAINVKSKKILSMKVTDEHVHDNKALPEMVNCVMESDKKIIIGKLFVDGIHDSNDIFGYLRDTGKSPLIKVRKSARIRLKRGKYPYKPISFSITK